MKALGKKPYLLVFAVLLVVIIVGCSHESSDTTAQGEAYMRVIIDSLGREVEIPARVESIAAAGSAARLITYAGCADKLVGVTDMDKENIVEMPYTVVNSQDFSRLPTVGSGGSKDICYHEELVQLKPDLVFSNMSLDTINDLQAKTGIPVVALDYSGIFDESVYDSLRLVGDIMGTKEHCTKVIESMRGWQEDLHNRTKDIPEEEKPTVYTGAVSFRGGRGFEGTHANYPPFTAINAKNVVDETGGDGAFMIDHEKVLVWDPEIIFLNPSNMNLVNEDYKKNPGFYDSLRAVKDGRVYTQLPYNYNNTNIEIAIADAYYAGKVIFPDQFRDIDPKEKADEIFQRMLGQPFYENLERADLTFGVIKIGE
ncbi:MAG: iron ABC transporter substrate-binding protein [Clostridia bacterium]|nr:iron ABC transporter substrate-binding protein [Clostridia bacterium]